jgi:hypothetical protein
VAGYYFNSALVRLGAAREITRKLFSFLDKEKKVYGPGILQADVDSIYDEYGSFKHALRSFRLGRRVTFDQAIGSLDELVRALDARRIELADPNTRFPRWGKRH